MSHALLRQLFAAESGCETDGFKRLQAALTVVCALGTAASSPNPHASRLGFFLQSLLAEGAIHRTRIHCYLVDPVSDL